MLKPLIQKIVVAVNGSEKSIAASMYAILLAKEYKCELKALYVVDTTTLKQLTMSKFFVAEESKRYEENLLSDGKRDLNYVQGLAKSKSVKIETELRKGSVWSEIVRTADEFKADLLILGGTGDSSAGKHSSVGYEVVTSAPCNVMIVRQQGIEKLFKIA